MRNCASCRRSLLAPVLMLMVSQVVCYGAVCVECTISPTHAHVDSSAEGDRSMDFSARSRAVMNGSENGGRDNVDNVDHSNGPSQAVGNTSYEGSTHHQRISTTSGQELENIFQGREGGWLDDDAKYGTSDAPEDGELEDRSITGAHSVIESSFFDIDADKDVNADFNGSRRKRLYFWEPMGLRFNSFRRNQVRKENVGAGSREGPGSQGVPEPNPQKTPANPSTTRDRPIAANSMTKETPKALFLELAKYMKENLNKKKVQSSSEKIAALIARDSSLMKEPTTAISLKLLKLQQAANALKTRPTKYLSFPLHFYRFMYTPGKKRG